MLETRLEALASEVEDLREQIAGKTVTAQSKLHPNVIENISKTYAIKSDKLALPI